MKLKWLLIIFGSSAVISSSVSANPFRVNPFNINQNTGGFNGATSTGSQNTPLYNQNNMMIYQLKDNNRLLRQMYESNQQKQNFWGYREPHAW